MSQTNKLQSLINSIKSQDESSRNQLAIVKINHKDLIKHELFEVLRLGYWPVNIIAQQHHWLCKAETIDDTGYAGYLENDQDIHGYQLSCYIRERVAISFTLAQGNVLDIDGDTQLEFLCYDMDAQKQIACQTYSITGLEQMNHIIDTDWPLFIQSAWPAVDAAIKDDLSIWQSKCVDDDSKTFHAFSALAWDKLNGIFLEDLVKYEFYDWDTMDAIESWYSEAKKIPQTHR